MYINRGKRIIKRLHPFREKKISYVLQEYTRKHYPEGYYCEFWKDIKLVSKDEYIAYRKSIKDSKYKL